MDLILVMLIRFFHKWIAPNISRFSGVIAVWLSPYALRFLGMEVSQEMVEDFAKIAGALGTYVLVHRPMSRTTNPDDRAKPSPVPASIDLPKKAAVKVLPVLAEPIHATQTPPETFRGPRPV